MELTQTDGRGNTTTQVTDLAGRTLSVTDAAGGTTTTTYEADSDQPATVTDALGNTAHYRYDLRGRKVAEWGTAIQPALYAYDDADRLTALTTFRSTPATNADGSPSQSATGAAAGDTTTWTYDDATGLEIEKRYADGSTVTKTYDSFGNPATETNARGQVTRYTYDSFRNLLLAIRYSDDTEDETFAYNHLGQLTQVTDAAGTRTISYNRYGEAETDSLLAGSMTHTITEQRDTLGRSTGYTYAKNGIPQQQTTIGYGADGRIASAGFTHQGEQREFAYTYLPGTHLLHTLTHPNGLTLTQSYNPQRDLPTQMDYTRADALIVRRGYTYDILGRPTARDLARYGTEAQDTFGYNTRSELTTAHVNSADYSYAYDAIGNRTSAVENGTTTAYTANRLNQYTAEGDFRPTFDADGNQTLIKTSTGIWNVTYNAKNRPVRFEKTDSSIVVECTYDTMGRRATKKVTTNGILTEHRRFLYRGYLQIACCDLTRAYTPALWYILWDPTQPTATRPLAIQKNGTWYTYGWDLTKNICETYRTDGRIDLAYTYTPYGEVSPAHTYDQPLRWSSEYHDTELGLVYYNYRHYNPAMGRWIGRDSIGELDAINVYIFIQNQIVSHTDVLGLKGDGSLVVSSCLRIKAKIKTVSFWKSGEDEIRNGDVIILRKGFTIIYFPVWKTSSECQKKKEEFENCSDSRFFASFKYNDYEWRSQFTRSMYKVIYGVMERTEVSVGEAAFGNNGNGNLKVVSDGFGVAEQQLVEYGIVQSNIFQESGSFEDDIQFTIIRDYNIPSLAHPAHRIEKRSN